MCGIIGYTGTKRSAKDAVLVGLKKLEYRGYDSAGIAVFEDGKIDLYKSKGKIVNLEKLLENKDLASTSGIGHTRWATHGEPNETNAHPHRSGKITLVHNGIIENYNELKDKLLSEGVCFKSETDTEVACAYIDYMYKTEKDKIKCLIKATDDFRGSYAFGILFEDEPETIYATRKDSPLIIGITYDNENFIASDVSAILDFTNKYILLEYGQYAKITKNSVEIYDHELKKIDYKINIADWSAAEYEKDGFDHFMLKEINEQPKVIASIIKKYKNDPEYIKKVDLSNYDAIHIVACGSAMHAGLVGKQLLEKYASIPVTVDVASEYRYKNQMITSKTLVIVVSQSGETADSLAALRIAKEKGATTLGIVNAIGSTIARESDICIYTYAGPEIAVATTKGYTSQVTVLALIALEAALNKKLISNEFADKVLQEFENIEDLLIKTIARNDEYLNIAKSIYKKENLFFIGRGIDSAVCMEGSLKLKEISYMHSEAYAAGELKHGTISLIENGTPVIALATDNSLYEKTVSNIKETKARGAFCILITTDDQNIAMTTDFADITLQLTKTNDFMQQLIIVSALQLIAYETAKLRGCDIDKPKNLAKSVTVE